MADDNRNLEDQLNILFDDFDEAEEEISNKAEQTVRKAEEAVKEVKAPENAPSVNIPTLDLSSLHEEKTEKEAQKAPSVPVFEAPKEAPKAKEIFEETPKAPDLDDSVIDTRERRLSFDDFDDLISGDDDDEAPVAYEAPKAASHEETEIPKQEKKQPEKQKPVKSEPKFVFDPIPDDDDEDLDLADPDYGDEPGEADELDAEYLGETASSLKKKREQERADRSTLKSVNQNSRRDTKQSSREEMRKESIRFWIFTAVVALIVAGAVLLILNKRGIIKLFDREPAATTAKESTAAPETTLAPTVTEAPTTEAPTTTETPTTEEPTTEEPTTEEPTSEAGPGPESVVNNYANMFIVKYDEENPERTLNVREAPSTDSAVKAYMPAYTGGEILENLENGWFKVRTAGIEGYIAGEYVLYGDEAKAIAAEHAVEGVRVTAEESLNIRIAASADAEFVDAAPRGAVLELLEEAGDFYRIRYAGVVEGYVSKEFTERGWFLKEATLKQD